MNSLVPLTMANCYIGSILIEMLELAGISYKTGPDTLASTIVTEGVGKRKFARLVSLMNFAPMTPNILMVSDEYHTIFANVNEQLDISSTPDADRIMGMVFSVLPRGLIYGAMGDPQVRRFNAAKESPLDKASACRLNPTTMTANSDSSCSIAFVTKAIQLAEEHGSSLHDVFSVLPISELEPHTKNLMENRLSMLRSYIKETDPTLSFEAELKRSRYGDKSKQNPSAPTDIELTDEMCKEFESVIHDAMLYQISIYSAINRSCAPTLFEVKHSLDRNNGDLFIELFIKFNKEVHDITLSEGEAYARLIQSNRVKLDKLDLMSYINTPGPDQKVYYWIKRRDLANFIIHVAHVRDITFSEAIDYLSFPVTDGRILEILQTRIPALATTKARGGIEGGFLDRKFNTMQDVNEALFK